MSYRNYQYTLPSEYFGINKEKDNLRLKYEQEIKKQKNEINNLTSKYNEINKEKDNLKIKYEKTIKDQKNEINKNVEQINDITSKYNEINKEKDNLKIKYEKIIKELNNQIQINNDKIQKLSNENNQNKEKVKKQISETIELKENLKKKEKELSDLNGEKESMIKSFKRIDNIEKENEDLKKKNLELKEIEKKVDKLENVIKNSSTKDDFLTKSGEQFYDVVIDIDSINALKYKGWGINYNEERKEIYEKIINEETIKIGVLGLNNVGKSFILGLIANVIIPTGHSIATKGISIKYTEGENESEKGVCLLDSAGFETPLLKDELLMKEKKEDLSKKDEDKNINDENNKSNTKKTDFQIKREFDELEYELAKDKTQTERFIEQLIITLSDMLILVIGKLTRTEQKLITRIKNIVKERDNCQINSIIIIHNLAQYHKKIEIDNHINNSLKQSATFHLIEKKIIGIKGYEDRTFFVEESNQGDIKVVHYIMAKQGTEAGDYYNNLTLQLIKHKYNDCNNRKAIDIPKEIVKLFSELSSEITEEKIDSNQLEISENNKIVKMKKDGNSDNENKLIRIQNAYIDEYGDYKSNNNKFNPKYSLYVYKDYDQSNKRKKLQNYLLLRLELPGKIDKLKVMYYKNEKYKGLRIKGKKSKEEFPEESKKNFEMIKNNRTFEDFEYFIQLKESIELIDNFADDLTEIYTFKFDRKNWEDSEENTNNEETEYSNELTEEDKNEYISTIAGGIYVFKFKLSQASLS